MTTYVKICGMTDAAAISAAVTVACLAATSAVAAAMRTESSGSASRDATSRWVVCVESSSPSASTTSDRTLPSSWSSSSANSPSF